MIRSFPTVPDEPANAISDLNKSDGFLSPISSPEINLLIRFSILSECREINVFFYIFVHICFRGI